MNSSAQNESCLPQDDPLSQYVATTSGLHHKMGRIKDNSQATAASLSRAAAALRALARGGK